MNVISYSYNLRTCFIATLVVFSVYLFFHAYISLLLWCPDGSPNCYTNILVTSRPRDDAETNQIYQNDMFISRSSAYRTWLPSHTGSNDSFGNGFVANDANDNNIYKLKNSSSSSPSLLLLLSSSSSPSSPPSSSPSSHLSSNLLPKQSAKIIEEYHAKTLEFRHRFHCPSLINGSVTEIQKVLEFHQKHRPPDGYQASNPSRVRSMFNDCQTFRRIRGYSSDSSGTPEERDFSLAYVILAHKDFDHLERLLRALYRPHHVFCIHLDQKVNNSLKQAVSGLASCFPNVIMASTPQSIIYAHMSRLMADIGCMQDLLKLGNSWKYLINTAATAFPLRTNMEMVRILKVLNGRNDIHEVFALRVPARWQVEYRVYKGRMRPTEKAMPPPPHNLTILKGQAYNTYSRAFLQWTFKDQKAKDLLKWSTKTYSPDEHYWATLNNLYHNPALRSPGGFTGNPDKKGYITMLALWAKNANQGHACQGRNVHNVCQFGVGDLKFLSKKMSLTCNKFDLEYDPVAYACMEELFETKTRTSDSKDFDIGHYKRLRFVWYGRGKETKKGEETKKGKKEGKWREKHNEKKSGENEVEKKGKEKEGKNNDKVKEVEKKGKQLKGNKNGKVEKEEEKEKRKEEEKKEERFLKRQKEGEG